MFDFQEPPPGVTLNPEIGWTVVPGEGLIRLNLLFGFVEEDYRVVPRVREFIEGYLRDLIDVITKRHYPYSLPNVGKHEELGNQVSFGRTLISENADDLIGIVKDLADKGAEIGELTLLKDEIRQAVQKMDRTRQ